MSLVVQWLKDSNAGGLGLIPGQGTQFYMLQIKVCMPQVKTPHTTSKDPACCE